MELKKFVASLFRDAAQCLDPASPDPASPAERAPKLRQRPNPNSARVIAQAKEARAMFDKKRQGGVGFCHYTDGCGELKKKDFKSRADAIEWLDGIIDGNIVVQGLG